MVCRQQISFLLEFLTTNVLVDCRFVCHDILKELNISKAAFYNLLKFIRHNVDLAALDLNKENIAETLLMIYQRNHRKSWFFLFDSAHFDEDQWERGALHLNPFLFWSRKVNEIDPWGFHRSVSLDELFIVLKRDEWRRISFQWLSSWTFKAEQKGKETLWYCRTSSASHRSDWMVWIESCLTHDGNFEQSRGDRQCLRRPLLLERSVSHGARQIEKNR